MTTYFRSDFIASLISILAGVIILGAYLGLWWHPPETGMILYWRVGVAVALIVVAMICVGIFLGVANRKAPQSDEREALVALYAMRNTCYAYAGGVAFTFLHAFDGLGVMDVAHAMIGIIVFAEAVRVISLAWYLSRGI
ncbi:hypothetical protein [Hyphomonas sp.]|uniref:hypothetical protein n=1 Tax=Hyphomonas sp. TaxID=87 RepID=UPI00352742D2